MNKCAHCGNDTTNEKYCSRSCSGKAGSRPVKETGTTKCVSCGEEFEWVGGREKAKRFCNRSCAASYNNVGVRRYPERGTIKCLRCGNDFTPQRSTSGKYCSAVCASEYIGYKYVRMFIDGKYTTATGLITSKNVRAYILETQDGKCAICKCPPEHNGKPLTFIADHINGDSNNSTPENVRLVCPNCDTQLPTHKSKNKGKGRAYRRDRYAAGLSY